MIDPPSKSEFLSLSAAHSLTALLPEQLLVSATPTEWVAPVFLSLTLSLDTVLITLRKVQESCQARMVSLTPYSITS